MIDSSKRAADVSGNLSPPICRRRRGDKTAAWFATDSVISARDR